MFPISNDHTRTKVQELQNQLADLRIQTTSKEERIVMYVSRIPAAFFSLILFGTSSIEDTVRGLIVHDTSLNSSMIVAKASQV
jgi:hypothetical protein